MIGAALVVALVVLANDDPGGFVRPVEFFPLVRDRVRYVGAPVAVVVAEDRYLAEDAIATAVVDYEPLLPVASMEEALLGTTRLYDEWPDNKVLDLQVNNPEVDSIFRTHKVIRGTYKIHRHSGVPIETRGCLSQFDWGTDVFAEERFQVCHAHVAP